MKYNNQIDFFSSPCSKVMAFFEIRQPQHDINSHDIHEQDQQQEKKSLRKFSYSNAIQPIMPLGNDFFEQKQEEYDELSSYNQQQNDPFFIHEKKIKTLKGAQSFNDSIMKALVQEQNKKTHFQPYENMFSDPDQDKKFIKEKMITNLEDQFSTPKKKIQFLNSKRFIESTAQKSNSKNNQKGLRRLSTLAYEIVNHSPATTYKQVAQKLLTHLNFDCTDLDDEECRAQKSSMQNVKRRVYDSLNVLIALGVISRVGNKITRQIPKKNLLAGQYSDTQKYNDLVKQYNKKLVNIQTKRKTERQLRQKLSIFKKTIERNKKTKLISKNKTIKLPFLVFATNQRTLQQGINKNIQWISNKKPQDSEKEKKKSQGKRNKQRSNEQKQIISEKINQKSNESVVQIKLKDFPQSYGDLDFFKLIQQETFIQNLKFDQYEGHHNCEKQMINDNNFGYEIEDIDYHKKITHSNQMMNLIDEVFEYQ